MCVLVSCSRPLPVREGSCLVARRHPVCLSQHARPYAATRTLHPSAHVTCTSQSLLGLLVRAHASPWQPANNSLQRTLGNVAKIREYHRMFRVVKVVQVSLGACEL